MPCREPPEPSNLDPYRECDTCHFPLPRKYLNEIYGLTVCNLCCYSLLGPSSLWEDVLTRMTSNANLGKYGLKDWNKFVPSSAMVPYLLERLLRRERKNVKGKA